MYSIHQACSLPASQGLSFLGLQDMQDQVCTTRKWSLRRLQQKCSNALGAHALDDDAFTVWLRSAGNKELPHAQFFLGCLSEAGKPINTLQCNASCYIQSFLSAELFWPPSSYRHAFQHCHGFQHSFQHFEVNSRPHTLLGLKSCCTVYKVSYLTR